MESTKSSCIFKFGILVHLFLVNSTITTERTENMKQLDLDEIRGRIDSIDSELVKLFCERMDIVADVARYKAQNNIPVYDKTRETALLQKLTQQVSPDMEGYVYSLYDIIFNLSRNRQSELLRTHTPLHDKIQTALKQTPQLFPPSASVAVQGTEGAYSQQATERLFRRPSIMYCKNFGGVFAAVESGLCKYGVVPLDNSTAGSVNQTYDLMMKHNFFIARSIRLKVDHNLLVNPGVDMSEIKEIVSHEQAFAQSGLFLEKHFKGVKQTVLENTALSAKYVAESGRRDVAAIASRNCAQLYNLTKLHSDIQDQGNNYTRFICISKDLEIFPGADRSSIMMVTSHSPGALYKALARFYSLGLNLIKLESRPMPTRDFQFMFYFDLESSIYSDEFSTLMDSMQEISEEFQYLGSYTEVL